MTRLPSFHGVESVAVWVIMVALAVGLTIFAGLELRKAVSGRTHKRGLKKFVGRLRSIRPGRSVAWIRQGWQTKDGLPRRIERRLPPWGGNRTGGRRIVWLSLVMAPVTVVIVAFSVIPRTPASSGPEPMFRASFSVRKGQGSTGAYAIVTVGERVWLDIQLDPGSKALDEPEIDIEGPGSISFWKCFRQFREKRRVGYVNGPDAHIGLGGLPAGETAKVGCELSVERRMSRQGVVVVSLSSPDRAGTERRRLFLEKPGGRSGREAAEGLIERELRGGPAAWSSRSFSQSKSVVVRVGREWPLLSLSKLHGFWSLPHGRQTTLEHVWSNREQAQGLIEFKAVIGTSPVTVKKLGIGNDGLRSERELFAIGETVTEPLAWCTTTRSTAQPVLQPGEHVQVQAAVLGFAISAATHEWAAMLDCPAVRESIKKGPAGGAIRQGGATTAIERGHR
jgi:hypothetical protein